MTTTTTTEIESRDFVELFGDVDGYCEANLTHDPKGRFIGFADEDYDDRPGSRFVWRGAWKITNRHGHTTWACEDCVGAIEDHNANLGEPDEGLDTIGFELIDSNPPGVECEANMQHNAGHGGGGQFSVDYGHIRPQLKLVCGHCLEHVLADLRVMGWPTVVDPDESWAMGPLEFIERMREINPAALAAKES